MAITSRKGQLSLIGKWIIIIAVIITLVLIMTGMVPGIKKAIMGLFT